MEAEPSLPSGLSSDSAEEREVAYCALEAGVKSNRALAATSVPRLTELLGQPSTDVMASEFMRVALLLSELAAVDPAAFGGSWMEVKGPRRMWAENNALYAAVSKSVADIDRTDAMLCCATQSITMAMLVRGYDAALGIAGYASFHEWQAATEPYAWYTLHDDQINIKLSLLIFEALQDQEFQLSGMLRSGAWSALDRLASGRPAVAVVQVQSSGLQLALEEFKRAQSPLEWVSISRTPSSKYAAVLESLCTMAAVAFDFKGALVKDEHKEVAATILTECLKSYEQLDDPGDANVEFVFYVAATLVSASSAASALQRARVHEAATAMRYMLDNPLTLAAGYMTTASIGLILAVIVYGREEADDDDAGAEARDRTRFNQQEVDEAVSLMQDIFEGHVPMPLQPAWSDVMVNFCVSDSNKLLLVNSPQLVPTLLLGLFVAEDHPRGANAAVAAMATERSVQELYQRKYAEAIGQLVLTAPGLELLVHESEVKSALQTVASSGLSDEAKRCAEIALIGFEPKIQRTHNRRTSLLVTDADIGGTEGGHVMISYNWTCQSVIMKLNHSLRKRGYLVWVDVEQMRRDTMEMMAAAVEGAEVFLFGVCQAYKESVNCRMEAQYAMQTEGCDSACPLACSVRDSLNWSLTCSSMFAMMIFVHAAIPLMMEQSYKPTGWLGLMLGARMYYKFIAIPSEHEDAGGILEDEARFEEQVDRVCTEIGDRGMLAQPQLSDENGEGDPGGFSEAIPPNQDQASPTSGVVVSEAAVTRRRRRMDSAASSRSIDPEVHSRLGLTPSMHSRSVVDTCDVASLDDAPHSRRSSLMLAQQKQSDGAELTFEQAPIVDPLELEARLRAEMDSKMKELKMEVFTHTAIKPAISDRQITALQTRLEAMHAAKLLTDDELYDIMIANN